MAETTGDAGALVKNEPLIKNTIDGTEKLYVNSAHSTGHDFSRLSVNVNDNIVGNAGAGLGTQYEAPYGLADSCGKTARPQADAEMRAEMHHGGSGGGMQRELPMDYQLGLRLRLRGLRHVVIGLSTVQVGRAGAVGGLMSHACC